MSDSTSLTLKIIELKPEHFRWYHDFPISIQYRPGYNLTPAAYALLQDYQYQFAGEGCTCFKGHAPCSECTHPGNPANINENDECWYKITKEELYEFSKRIRDKERREQNALFVAAFRRKLEL